MKTRERERERIKPKQKNEISSSNRHFVMELIESFCEIDNNFDKNKPSSGAINFSE
jgi:hypothetical protein